MPIIFHHDNTQKFQWLSTTSTALD